MAILRRTLFDRPLLPPLAMLMSAYEQLLASESAEPTCLEKRFGELLVVPLHASDDNIAELRHYGVCIWKSGKMQH